MNTTKIVRSPKDSNNPFTRMSNSIGNLKADEVGVMFQILSNSDSWVLNKKDIQRRSKLGRDRFESIWNHLKELGYIVISRLPLKDGRFRYSYNIYEEPRVQNPGMVIENPDTDFRSTEKGNTGTGGTNNNYKINTNERIKVESGVDPRNEVERDTRQSILDILGPDMKNENEYVPTPSLRCGEGRDIHEGHINNSSTGKEILNPVDDTPTVKENMDHIDITPTGPPDPGSRRVSSYEELARMFDDPTDESHREMNEFEPDEQGLNEFIVAIDDLYQDYFPDWKKMLKNTPLHVFLRETSKVHRGTREIIEMISWIHRKFKYQNSTYR